MRQVVPENELEMIVSNIGVTPDSPPSTPATPRLTPLRPGQSEGGPQDRQLRVHGRVRQTAGQELPQLSAYFQSGGLWMRC